MATNFVKYFEYCLSCNDFCFSELRRLYNLVNDANRTYILINYNGHLKVNPLWMAVYKKKINLVRFLVEECNANVNEYFFLGYIDEDNPLKGSSPMFVATYLRYYDIARYLVKCGANINIPNGMGTTPLMESVHNEQFCQYLMKEGENVINLNLRDSKGLTAVDYAIIHHSFNVAISLLRNGAICFSNVIIVNVAFRLNNCNYSDEEKLNVLKTIGETYCHFDKGNIANAWELLSVGLRNTNLKKRCLEKAIEIRQSENISKKILPYNDDESSFYYKYDANCKNYHHAEFVSIVGEEKKEFTDSLETMIDTPLNLKIQEIFICERILPQYNILYIEQLLKLSKLLRDDEKKLHLLCYALKFCSLNKYNATLTTSVLKTYLSFFSSSSSYCHYKFLCHLMGKMYRNEFEFVDEATYLYFFLDILYLFLNYNNNDNNNNHRAIISLIQRGDFSGKLLLHIIVSYKFKIHVKSFLGIDEIFTVRSLLLKFLVVECGFEVNYKNNFNKTPLLIAAVENFELNLIKLLITELGAHVDMHPSCYDFFMNKYNHYNDEENSSNDEIYQIINNSINLKCLSARVIKKHKIPYQKYLCPILEKFIDIH